MRSTIHGFRIAVIAMAGYWMLLFISTHIPANALMARLHQSDKLLHAGAFAGLAFLIAWAIPTVPSRLSQNVFVAGVVGIVYAGVDELLQIPVGRTADWLDFCADCVGIFLGLTVYMALRAYVLKANLNLLNDPSQNR